jgi:hypothetical protein
VTLPSGDLGEAHALPTPAEVLSGLAEAEQREGEAQEEIEGSAARAERAESRQAYSDATASEAEQLIRERFGTQLQMLNGDPARLLSDATLVKLLGNGEAGVVSLHGKVGLLEAGVPINAAAGEGEAGKVDLSLVEDDEGGFEADNPLTQVALPPTAAEPVDVGSAGLSVEQVGAGAESEAQLFGDKNAFYPEAQTDTDMLVSPIAHGIDISDQLRSVESPEILRFQLEMPAGAELAEDGQGGAKVVQGGKAIANVPFPTAVDAQGTNVPIELEIDGEELVIHVRHRSAGYAYPILVDPSLNENWYGASWYNGSNLQALTDGAWSWGTNTNWVYGSTSCIYTCWGSGRGLYVSTPNGSRGPGQFGQWAYSPPGASSYITDAWIYPFFRDNHNCSKNAYAQPHDYDGLWSPGGGWIPAVHTNDANDYGSSYLGGHGTALIIGMGSAEANMSIPCWRDIVAGGVSVLITDPDVPYWISGPSAPDQWTDTAVVPISTGAAYDNGLGVKYFNVYRAPAGGKIYGFIGNAERACSGLRENPCTGAWSAQITNYNPAALPNGVNWLEVSAYDALGIEHYSQGLPVHVDVDHSAPEIAFRGGLFSAEAKSLKGEVVATDGSSAEWPTAQSGMKSVRLYFDGQLAGRWPEEANPPACTNMQQGINMGSCQFYVPFELNSAIAPGQHTFRAVAVDSLNHTSERTVTLNLPKDEVAPTLSASGPLKAAAGGVLNASETSVTLDAEDKATGVTEGAIYVDGTRQGAPFTQECYAGGCAFHHEFPISFSGYGDGWHSVKALVRDAAGNTTEMNWSIVRDTKVPSLDSVTAPDVPPGWFPQVESVELHYAASDAGVGIKTVEVLWPSTAGQTKKSTPYSSNCTGGASSPCQASISGSTSISTADMPQGIDNVTVKAYDAIGRVSSTRSVTVFVDRSAPTITEASGPLLSAAPRAPVAAWSFDEAEGSVVRDLTGHGHDGTVEGAHWVSGKLGDALSFGWVQGAPQQCVTVPDSPELQLSKEFTLEAWVRPEPENKGGGRPVLIKESEPEPGAGVSYAMGLGWFLEDSLGGYAGSEGAGEELGAPQPLEEGSWSHVAYTYDGYDLRLFVDGKQVSYKRVDLPELRSTGPLEIGCDGFGEQFEGKLDEVRIYDRALNPGEVRSDMEAPIQGDGQPARPPVGLATELRLGASDVGSGVASVELRLDGETVEVRNEAEIAAAGGTQTCSGEVCELDLTIEPIVGAGLEPGQHHFELVVKDAAGHSATVSNDVRIDTHPPDLKLSGSLIDSAGRELPEWGGSLAVEADDGNGGYDSGVADLEVLVDGSPAEQGPALCDAGSCPPKASLSFDYDQAKWGTGPHTVEVLATDQSGNTNVRKIRVNEPLDTVSPTCPSAEAQTLSGGQEIGAAALVSELEADLPTTVEPNDPLEEGSGGGFELEPTVTENAEGVSINEMGIDVDGSLMGGGIDDARDGAFTVGQATCLQPLQTSEAAAPPALVGGSAVLFANSAPDTDTVLRPTAFGSTIVEHLRGAAAPDEFSWAVSLEPGEELVELEDGGIAAVRPGGDDQAEVGVPPAPAGGVQALNDVETQVAQAEHDLAVANNEVDGEVTMVIAVPEAISSSGETVVPGILRIVGARSVVAELPPNARAETEAMIIRMNPPAEPESICASVLARAPQYAWRVCGGEAPEAEGDDGGNSYGLWDLATTPNAQLNNELSTVFSEFGAIMLPEGAATGSSSSSYEATESDQQKKFCQKHAYPLECAEFIYDGLLAAEAEEALFYNPDDGTLSNAFRHSFWVALMREDNPGGSGHVNDGLVWSYAHEEGEWSKTNPHTRRREGSRMDILNDTVGWRHGGNSEMQSCEIMLHKATPWHAFYIEPPRDPFEWAHNHGYEYFNLVYRKLRGFNETGPNGAAAFPNGLLCSQIEIGF